MAAIYSMLWNSLAMVTEGIDCLNLMIIRCCMMLVIVDGVRMQRLQLLRPSTSDCRSIEPQLWEACLVILLIGSKVVLVKIL